MPPIPKDDSFSEILEQIEAGSAVFFLGAGSTRACKKADGSTGLTGEELSREILLMLNHREPPGFSVSLTEAAEFFATWKAGSRGELDRTIQDRLKNLQPTIGHYIATTFPWRAVITTNYNQVAEDCWGSAQSDGYAANEILPMRTDDDMVKHAGNTTHTRFYKPHGCITIQMQKQHRMVITSLDYFESERIRPKMYNEIRTLGETCSTIFVGYSMNDYTFRNIFYRLYSDLGPWAVRSFSVSPVEPELKRRWMARSLDKNFNTTLIDDAFDTFMIRLAINRGHLASQIKRRIIANWTEISTTNGSYMEGIDHEAIQRLRDSAPRSRGPR